MKDYVNDELSSQTQYDGLKRIVKAIVFQILDYISISKKWDNRNVSLKTLLDKKSKLRDMNKWLVDWRWDIWLRIYTEHYGGEIKIIKKNFIKIRKKSIKEVNRRIKQYETENK